ncbi:hypothetical protein JTE90_016987 [Oedothorax gibbosus]|uniref:GRAM domain-containing protein n=1 Tax=Oedothorax gibbosus TaxID=931172 RepID=A0AAV6UNP2_9ARAC|nr:hypothetical protein JTE90_016987 [Oedothorax gibbosus]
MPTNLPISTPTTPPSPLPHSRLARSHNRRFHVRFPGVDSEEHLLNYYSCALVADILLQGHLYITENYYAFYSNIFGRKTQILLPVGDVIKVTKERTAKIIPNAVGLYTVEGKYVFGSLLQRNTTYRLMHHVWLKSADPDTTEDEPTPSDPSSEDAAAPVVPPPPPVIVVPPPRPDELPIVPARRLSRRKSDLLFPRITAKGAARRQRAPPPPVDQVTLSKCPWDCAKSRSPPPSFTDCFTGIEENVHTVVSNNYPKSTIILLGATLLLVLLFLLATILVYRVSTFHNRSPMDELWPTKAGYRLSGYLELLKQQQEAVEEEIRRITTTLKQRLHDLGQVRQSIDQISEFAKQSAHQTKQADDNNKDDETPAVS